MKTRLGLVIFLLAAALARAQTNNLTALLQQGLFEEQANRNLDAAIADYQALARQFDKDRQLAATAVFRLGECYRMQGKTNEAALEYQRILRDFSDQTTLATLSRQDLVGMGMARPETATMENTDAELWNKLNNLSQPQLEKILPTLVPDATLNDLLQERHVAESKRASLVAQGFTTNNALLANVDASLVDLNRQISEKISGMLQALKLRAELPPSVPAVSAARQQQRELLAKQIALAEQDLVETQKLVQVGKAPLADSRAAEREVLRLRQQLAALDAGKAELLDLSVPVKSEEDQEIERVEKLLQTSPDLINKHDKSGNTLLSKATVQGQTKVVNYLLDHGADVNDGALYAATHAGNRAMAELLLQRGANANWGGLTDAAQEGFVSLVELLLAHKADPNVTDGLGQTPLFLAVYYGHEKCARLLLAHGADPNIARKAESGQMNRDDGRRMFGAPLHTAAANGSTEMAALLLTNRADVKVLNAYSETPLQVAAACGHAEVAELLLSAGADPNARVDSNHSTPLHLAVSGGYRDVVEKLLAHGANPNATAAVNGRVITPLMLAATGGNDDIALLLLQQKANPNLKDDEGNTALVRAIAETKTAVVKTLLTHGANPQVKGGEWPALMIAAGRRNPEMTSALLAAGADVNEVAGGQLETALHQSATSGNLEIVQILLAAHANVNLRNLNGDSPLHLAVRNGKEDVVQLLLDAKADPNLRNNSGATPLDIAKNGPRNTAAPLPRPGGVPGLPGTPASYQRNNSAQPVSAATNSLANLLRQHGALDNLPDWDRITVSRPSTKYSSAILFKGTNDWNQFTLFDLLGVQYDLLTAAPGGVSRVQSFPYGVLGRSVENLLTFSDFSRIVIHRPPTSGTNWTELKINLARALDSGDCTGDVPLQFGDVVEIPEADHLINESWRGLSTNALFTLKNCLTRHLQITVNGQTRNHTVAPQVETVLPESDGYLRAQYSNYSVGRHDEPEIRLTKFEPFMLWPVLKSSYLLLASSELSRVTVKRRDGATGKTREWTVDCSNPNSPPAFWLRDGDVIEVPGKP